MMSLELINCSHDAMLPAKQPDMSSYATNRTQSADASRCPQHQETLDP